MWFIAVVCSIHFTPRLGETKKVFIGFYSTSHWIHKYNWNRYSLFVSFLCVLCGIQLYQFMWFTPVVCSIRYAPTLDESEKAFIEFYSTSYWVHKAPARALFHFTIFYYSLSQRYNYLQKLKWRAKIYKMYTYAKSALIIFWISLITVIFHCQLSALVLYCMYIHIVYVSGRMRFYLISATNLCIKRSAHVPTRKKKLLLMFIIFIVFAF